MEQVGKDLIYDDDVDDEDDDDDDDDDDDERIPYSHFVKSTLKYGK